MQTNCRPVTLFALFALLLSNGLLLAGDSPYQGNAERFSALHQLIPFFADRLASKHDFVRYRLMADAGELLPMGEAEQLLREMARVDPDLATRQQALVRLVSRGYRIDSSEMPRKFSWPGWPVIDTEDEEQMRQILRELRGEESQDSRDDFPRTSIKRPGPQAGSAIQLLGLLGDRSDVARLRPLLDSENIFIRFSAAIALINLGGTRSGIEGLNRIAQAEPEPSNHVYVTNALLTLRRSGDKTAVYRYLDYLAVLEADDEHHARLHYTQGLEELGQLFGIWRDDIESWRSWWEKHRRAE